MLMRSPVPAWRRRVPPGFIPPCQPVLADRVPSGDGWLHELKHDGFRIIARKEGDHVRLWSRNARDWSAEFVAITAALRELPADFVLDGEAVAHCSEGLPDFHGLLGRDGQRTACLRAFDLLHLRASAARGTRRPLFANSRPQFILTGAGVHENGGGSALREGPRATLRVVTRFSC